MSDGSDEFSPAPDAPDTPHAPDESIDSSAKPVLDYRTPTLGDRDVDRLVTLARMRITEADLAKIKLESEGIPCLIRDATSAIANSFIVTDVPILVRAEDLERAKAVLARPADDSMEGEYVDEDYRCPRCHRRDVELLPLSPGRRGLRALWIAMLVISFAWTILRAMSGINVGPRVDDFIEYAALPWLLIAIVLGVIVLLAKREKRCRACGHRWMRAGAAASVDP